MSETEQTPNTPPRTPPRAPLPLLHLHRPQDYAVRMVAFLVIVGSLLAILSASGQIERFFNANPGLNGLIVGVLLLGALYTFRQVFALWREIRWLEAMATAMSGTMSDSGKKPKKVKPPRLLAPMAATLYDSSGSDTPIDAQALHLTPQTTRSILDSIHARLDEARETTRYMVGLLVFLGLLGTFWGLLETIQGVGTTIGALDATEGSAGATLGNLIEGLKTPLGGMGIAFSSSLFGLSGSLILGFLDLQAGYAQGRFFNEVEEWLSALTEVPNETGAGSDQALAGLTRAVADLSTLLRANLTRAPNA